MSLQCGDENYNAIDAAFMLAKPSDNIIHDNNIDEKLNKLALSTEIKNFYKKFGSSTQEIYINQWTLFSIDKIIEMTSKYKEDDIVTIDIGMVYKGMGHVSVAFFHPKYNTILYRPDGGSNIWDRLANYNDLKKFNNLEFKKGSSFKDFINKITTESFEEF